MDKKGITNQWHKKHQDFSSSHDIRLRTITLEGYASNHANTSFVTFFLLNARVLLSVRIKVFNKNFLMDGHVEQHKKKFQVDKRAFERARLLFTTTCLHVPVDLLAQDLDFMDQANPFDCDCRNL